MKRFIAHATAALLGVGGVIAVAAPASAHHSTVTASVECAGGGNYTIKWHVQNWDSGAENLTAKVTSSSRGVVPVDTSFSDDETKTFNETVSNPQNLGLSVSLTWSNGATGTNSGSVGTGSFPDCTEDVTPTVPSVSAPTCQANGALVVPADTSSIGYTQSPSGSGPGVYDIDATAKVGFNIVGAKHWTLTVLPKLTGDQCDEEVVPTSPSANPPTCQANGALVVPADTASIDYSQDPAGSGPGTYEVSAAAKVGYKITGTKAWSVDVLPKLIGEQCDVVATPVAPNVVEIDECGEYGSIAFATTEGVTYALTTGNGTSGVYFVTASANSGYKFADGAQSVFSGNLGTHTECVTPALPTASPPTCETAGVLTVPGDTVSIDYSQDPAGSGPGTYEVTATAKAGYSITGQSAWTVTVEPKKTGVDCDEVVTATAPSVSEPTCDQDGLLTVPGDTSSIDYSQDPAGSGPGTYDVAATAKAGYTLNGTKQWSLTVLPKLTGVQCDEVVTPVAPNVVAIDECNEFGAITFANTEGVTYAVTSGNGVTGAYTVTATAKSGFTFANGVQTVFSGNLGAHHTCVTAPVPTEVQPTCEAPGSVAVPTATGVTYEIEDLGGGIFKVVVSATEGYELVGPTEWTIVTEGKLSGDVCDEYGPTAAPQVVSIDECGEFGSVTFVDTEVANYALTVGDGKQGAYEVTATPAPGYQFEDGAQTVFNGDLGTHTDCGAVDAADLDAGPLPDTGAATSLLMLLMIGSMVAVGAVLIAASRQPAVADQQVGGLDWDLAGLRNGRSAAQRLTAFVSSGIRFTGESGGDARTGTAHRRITQIVRRGTPPVRRRHRRDSARFRADE
ncbi:hypothetical protein [Aeromicrobium sp.]|uniref:hypothetical protein n=1 Tax=Aeromicrobium sp. TaxID=1871063 RepID=UPI002FCB9D3C